MADGVAVTAGTGTTILTDETASGHAQVVKLGLSTDASAALVPVTADGVAVIVRTETGSGPTIFRSTTDLDETEEAVKASAGKVYGFYFHNVASAFRYLKWYDATVGTVIVGTTVPTLTMGLPPTSAGWVSLDGGIAFATAITVACTTLVADADATAPTANDVAINVLYK